MQLRISRFFLAAATWAVLFLAANTAQAQDAAHPIRIAVDLREAPRRIFHSRLEIPAAPGPLTLVYPKWIPGEHGPNGPISDVAGVKFSALGRPIAWRRDDVDMYAFHCVVPQGATAVEVSLDFLSPSSAEGFATSPAGSAETAVLNWNLVLLYPLGPKSDDLTFVASLRLPAGWHYGTALPVANESGDAVEFKPASLTTLVDSTVLAGAHLKTIELSPGQTPNHQIHIAADSAAATEMSAEQTTHLKQLVAETGALFGARHYRRYDFLLALSDYLTSFGEEHHESSDNREAERMLLDPDILERAADLLPHEFFHSWNGKYRRPAGLATPDYQQPMKGELLWVYEGLTEYYGDVLTARSGFWTPERYREYLAEVAAELNHRSGRVWRDLQDTAVAAQILYTTRPEWSNWRRGVDFYDESNFIWLEADTIVRGETGGKRSLDDFCRRFHGGQSTPPKMVPYTFDDIIATMNETAPYDWRKFFTERLTSHGPGAPLEGLEASGWKLAYSETPNEHERSIEVTGHSTHLEFSLGFIVHNSGGERGGMLSDVWPGSPAALAGMAPGMRLLAVNGRRWSPEILHEAIRASKGSSQPIELLVENEEFYKTYRIEYHDGERYPHLERIPAQADVLTEIIRAKAPSAAGSKD
jgi:predicted metalloprotease with PDZ domain